MTTRRHQNRNVTEGIFSYDSTGFQIDYFNRATSRSLRRLLFPELIVTGKALQYACVKAARTITNGWIMAQLQHHDIYFEPGIDAYRTKALLATSVAQGLVNNLDLSHFQTNDLLSVQHCPTTGPTDRSGFETTIRSRYL